MDQTRRKMPDERKGIIHQFVINGNEGILRTGMYEDRTLGEVFIEMSKEGSTLSGLLDTVARMISNGLQRGTPLDFLVGKLANARYEPSGMTGHPCIPSATSITDYIARYLGLKFLALETLEEVGVKTKCHDCDKVIRSNDKTYCCFAEIPEGDSIEGATP